MDQIVFQLRNRVQDVKQKCGFVPGSLRLQIQAALGHNSLTFEIRQEKKKHGPTGIRGLKWGYWGLIGKEYSAPKQNKKDERIGVEFIWSTTRVQGESPMTDTCLVCFPRCKETGWLK